MQRLLSPMSAGNEDAATAAFTLISSLSTSQQVDLLAQALLREFLHRRGFRDTLRAFDEECPRGESTISSRMVMRRLLNIPVAGRQSRLVPSPQSKAPPATLMEEVCSHRLVKREYTKHLIVNESNMFEQDPSDSERDRLVARVQERETAIAVAEAQKAEGLRLLAEREEKKRKKKEKKEVEGHTKRKKRGTMGTTSLGESSTDDDFARGRRYSSDNVLGDSSVNSSSSVADTFSGLSARHDGLLKFALGLEGSQKKSRSTGAPSVGSSWQPPSAASSSAADEEPFGLGKAMGTGESRASSASLLISKKKTKKKDTRSWSTGSSSSSSSASSSSVSHWPQPLIGKSLRDLDDTGSESSDNSPLRGAVAGDRARPPAGIPPSSNGRTPPPTSPFKKSKVPATFLSRTATPSASLASNRMYKGAGYKAEAASSTLSTFFEGRVEEDDEDREPSQEEKGLFSYDRGAKPLQSALASRAAGGDVGFLTQPREKAGSVSMFSSGSSSAIRTPPGPSSPGPSSMKGSDPSKVTGFGGLHSGTASPDKRNGRTDRKVKILVD